MNRSYKTNIFIAALGIMGFIQASSMPVFADNTGNVNFSATLQSSTSVSIDNNITSINLAPTPTGAGKFGSEDINIVVSTNQPGYILSMITSSPDLQSGIINPDTNSSYTIPSLEYSAEGYTSDNFTHNHWGIAIDGGNFNAVTTTNQLKNTSATANADTTTVSFGVDLDLLAVSGNYQTTVVFTVLPKVFTEPEPTNINQITNMQDFAALSETSKNAIKNSMTVNTPYQLTDIRDGKKYWVTKLRTSNDNPNVAESSDGNKYQIWMTQNLDLDLEATPTNVARLDSTNTDINSASGIYTSGYTTDGGAIVWTPVRATTNNVANTQDDNATPYSYDPGTLYYYQGTFGTAASSTCNTANICNHWHIGNYYNWNAAVASNDTSSQATANVEMSNSICPKGWKLPAGITSTSSYSDFNYLLVQQGIAVNYVGAATNATWSPDNTNGYLNIQKDPLYILRSGLFYSGSLYYAGAGGHLWSSTASSSTTGYNLSWDSSGVNPAHLNNRYDGFPVRCIVR